MINVVNTRRLTRFVVVAALALASAPVSAEAPARHFLWRVTSPSSTVHLLGSIHLMKPSDYPLAEPIENAFSTARVVVFETDLDELDRAGLELLSAGTLPAGTRLRDVISPETYQLVEARLKEIGLPASGFEKMRPWMLATTLMAFELTRAGYSQTSGIDMHFFERAKQAGKRIVGLETVEFQVGLFTGLDAAQDEAFLRQTLEELELMIPEVESLLDHWRHGDVAEVEQMLGEGFEAYPELFRTIVTDRNRSWVPKIEEILNGSEDAMVVVGSLHIVGEEGLAALLRDAGYTVEQR